VLSGIVLIVPAAALAADGASSAPSEVLFIAEIALLLVVGRLMGEAAQRIGQPPVMGQLIGGLLLGPSLLGVISPPAAHALFPDSAAQKAMLDAVSQLGVLMLLLLTGMQTDLALVRRVGAAAVTVALAGIAVPFVFGFALGEWLPAALLPKPDARLVTAIFLGTALSISSVNIVAIVVRDMNFMRRDIGQIIVASAILEDALCWVIIAIAFGFASAGALDIWSIGRSIVGTVAFMAASLTVGRRLVFQLIRWANDNFETEFPVITVILVVMIAMALATQFIGLNTVLGAFVAGILIGESPIRTRHIDEQLHGLIVALFMPVFFGLSGRLADVTIFRHGELALLGAALILIASVGKFAGAFIGGKLGGLTRAESLALGCGMNARGSSQVIVATMGLSAGALNQNLFTLIVTMAVVTTTAMPAMLRRALKRLPLRQDERLRLEREALDAKGFVTNLERLLLAADDSANGKLAARLAGAIAGSGGKPTTILDLSKGGRDGTAGPRDTGKETAAGKSGRATAAAQQNGDAPQQRVEQAAEAVTTLEAHPDEEKPGRVDVITRQPESVDPEAVASEARKGYDFLVIGVGKIRDPDGGFSNGVSRIADGFEGPLAVADCHPDSDGAAERIDRILVPVNGTEVSRRAAEVALTLARATGATATALYVTRASASAVGGKRLPRRTTRRNEDAVLEEIGVLAERYGVDLRRQRRANAAPAEAILDDSRRGYDLIVLGVSRRPGDRLHFGDTAAAVLDRSTVSNLFVAS
jgi:Kef-type K+ transport system membrane component KefB/nucleotide-binding universal stress UspA family protein